MNEKERRSKLTVIIYQKMNEHRMASIDYFANCPNPDPTGVAQRGRNGSKLRDRIFEIVFPKK